MLTRVSPASAVLIPATIKEDKWYVDACFPAQNSQSRLANFLSRHCNFPQISFYSISPPVQQELHFFNFSLDARFSGCSPASLFTFV